MHRGPLDKAPDYTRAALIAVYANLLSALIVIWGTYGYTAALTVCLGLHFALRLWEARRR